MPAPTGSVTSANTMGTVRVAFCLNAWGSRGQKDVRRKRQQLLGVSLKVTGVARCPAIVDPNVAPSDQPNCCSPCRNAAMRACPFRVIRGEVHEHADAPHALTLLRARRERPSRRRTAKQRNELAPSHLRAHSITSSARASSVGRTSIASAFAA
jgi:hypothetical protein